jgi:hypothetical protein
MKRKICVAAALALLITACSGEKKDAEQASAGTPGKREAGNWKTDVKLVKLEVPGLNDSMKQSMGKMLEGMSGMEMCLTQEAADKENMAEKMSENASQGADCTFSKQEISGGTMDVVASCKTAQGQTLDLTMNGTMNSKKVDVNIATKGPLPAGNGQMEMVMQMTSSHTGPCKTS